MRYAGFILALPIVVSSLSSIATSQNLCATYFTTYSYFYMPIPNITFRPGMTSSQRKWFNKKGQKEYPTLCENPEKATYILVTRWQVNEVQEPVTVERHAYTTGPVTEAVGVTAAGSNLPPSRPVWATRMETFVTTWEEKGTKTGYRLHSDVFLLEAKKPLKEAVSPEDYSQPLPASYADGPDADRRAFERALWLLNILAKANK
jgi:hypothetical protein